MRVAFLVLALTAACSPPAPNASTAPEAVEAATMPDWDSARAQGVDFRAVGQEPGWMLDIYQRDTIKLIWDYGERAAAFPLVEPTYPQEGATRYATQSGGQALEVTIRRLPCQDAMSGESFPATVDITIDGRALNGCGRTL